MDQFPNWGLRRQASRIVVGSGSLIRAAAHMMATPAGCGGMHPPQGFGCAQTAGTKEDFMLLCGPPLVALRNTQ
jgi:hypothetical protein